MTVTIICAALIIAVAIVWSIPHSYDYHADLQNIAYQLSRIADALNRKERREEMTIKTCDKCGAKINTNPTANTILPMFSISRIEGFALGWQSVDLCPKCSKILAEWLNNKEEQNVET